MDPRYLTHGQYVAWRMARMMGRWLIYGAIALVIAIAILSLVGCDSREARKLACEAPPTKGQGQTCRQPR